MPLENLTDPDAIVEWLDTIPVLWTHRLEIPLDRDEAQPWTCQNRTLAAVLADYSSGACWAPYVTAAAWRLPSDYPGDVRFTAVVQEIDKAGKVYDPDDLPRIIDAFERAADDRLPLPNIVHASTSGAWAIWILDQASRARRPPAEYARIWWALCKDTADAIDLLLDGTGLYVDPAPCDPFRLWRCPFHTRRERVSGSWQATGDTFDRDLMFLTFEEYAWSSFRQPTVEEEDERGAVGPVRVKPAPVRRSGSLAENIRVAVRRSAALQDFFGCDQPFSGSGGTSGWNDRFRSAFGHVCARYLRHHPEIVDALEDLMLAKIERMGGDPEDWRKRRAQYTRR